MCRHVYTRVGCVHITGELDEQLMVLGALLCSLLQGLLVPGSSLLLWAPGWVRGTARVDFSPTNCPLTPGSVHALTTALHRLSPA